MWLWAILGLFACQDLLDLRPYNQPVGICGCQPLPVNIITDRFTVLPARPLDVLWVIDNSAPNSGLQTALPSELVPMLQVLSSAGSDTRVGVISTDMDDPTHRGRLQGPWIEIGDPDDLESVAALMQLGNNSPAEARPLDAVYAAISGHAALENNNFYRPAANLLIVILSDNLDHSDLSIDGFQDWLWHLKEPGARVDLTAIVSTDDTCAEGIAERILDVATQPVASVCAIEDWSTALSAASWRSLHPRRYFLTQIPKPGSVQLTVVDSDVRYTFAEDVDWTYQASDNSVMFTQFVPSPGSTLEVEYVPHPTE